MDDVLELVPQHEVDHAYDDTDATRRSTIQRWVGREAAAHDQDTQRVNALGDAGYFDDVIHGTAS